MLLALRWLDGAVGEMAGTVMLQMSNARKSNPEQAKILDRAWKRLQELQDNCGAVRKMMQKREVESAASHHEAGQKHKTDAKKDSKKKGGLFGRFKGK